MEKINRLLIVALIFLILNPKILADSNRLQNKKWNLISVDKAEGYGSDIKAVYGKFEDNVVYFKIKTYKKWDKIDNVLFMIFIDPDKYEFSGSRADFYRTKTKMGADAVLVIGNVDYPNKNIKTELLRYDDVFMQWRYSFQLAYLDFKGNNDEFVVGINYEDLARQVPRSIMKTPIKNNVYIKVVDILSDWDWSPDYMQSTFNLKKR